MPSALDEHFRYAADRVRLERFKVAVGQTVRHGNTVVDVGCGTGILGLLCLNAGAAKVWGVDSSSMIEVARESLARSKFASRYTCIAGNSHRIVLPEKVDVAICDHVGYFGFDYNVVATLQDVQQRFLKPGGKMIPSAIEPIVSLVQSETWRKKADAWGLPPVPVELRWLRDYGVNCKHAVKLKPGDIIGKPVPLGKIDLAANNPEFFMFKAEIEVDHDGIVDGLAGWFDCELAEGISMTNSPLSDTAINREQAFLPIDQPVPVVRGDRVTATVMARPTENMLAWLVEFPDSGQRFTHSTWQGMPLSPESMLRASPTRIPKVSSTGRARLIILGYCDGTRTAREIAAAVLRDHPTLLPSRSEICDFVAQVLGRDTE